MNIGNWRIDMIVKTGFFAIHKRNLKKEEKGLLWKTLIPPWYMRIIYKIDSILHPKKYELTLKDMAKFYEQAKKYAEA